MIPTLNEIKLGYGQTITIPITQFNYLINKCEEQQQEIKALERGNTCHNDTFVELRKIISKHLLPAFDETIKRVFFEHFKPFETLNK